MFELDENVMGVTGAKIKVVGISGGGVVRKIVSRRFGEVTIEAKFIPEESIQNTVKIAHLLQRCNEIVL